jgi:hypothetical protein
MNDLQKVELLRDCVTAVVEATKAYNSSRGTKGKLLRERTTVKDVLTVLLDRRPTEAEIDRVTQD